MILPVRHEQRKRREPIHDLIARFGTGKALEQLLKNESRGDDAFSRFQRTDERPHLGDVSRLIAPHKQRPNARIDEQAQRRALSFL
jgi:hypothetical protein